jgi:hypothetical protein
MAISNVMWRKENRNQWHIKRNKQTESWRNESHVKIMAAKISAKAMK